MMAIERALTIGNLSKTEFIGITKKQVKKAGPVKHETARKFFFYKNIFLLKKKKLNIKKNKRFIF